MASTATVATTPDYLTSLTKQLQPSKPLPVNNGPYLDQVGQMPIQAQMSPSDFSGSLGPNWAEMSKPGGYLDKVYSGQAQVMGDNGQPLSIKQVSDAVAASGHQFTPNPFLSIPTLEGQLYNNESKNVGNFYSQLNDALGLGRQDYEQRTGQLANTVGGYYDQAGRDVSQFGQGRVAANQDFANSIGLGGTTGAGSQSSVLADQLSRLGGINAVNKANAQSTLAQRQSIIDDLLQQRALSAATQGAQTQSAIAEMAAQHWGLDDPNRLWAQYMMNKDQVGAAMSQIELQKQQLAAQLLQALKPAAGGGKGGGGGRRSGGGGSGGTSTSDVSPGTNEQTVKQLADNWQQVIDYGGQGLELPPGVDLTDPYRTSTPPQQPKSVLGSIRKTVLGKG